ncbi:uncharacterized protein LOC117226746 [Megalopta genalis]|uniref:uncharacterized protein LOC117226746 n=1 Tax=Megalopta genalis TaxID=115081 RepID=UPI003FD565DB
MACSRTTTESCIQWGSINGGEIEFESLTENTLEGALEVIRKSFFPNESICKGINLLSDPCSVKALEEVCLAVTRDGVSLVAIEVKTQKVFREDCEHHTANAYLDLMIAINDQINLFEYYDVDCIMECMFLATLPEMQQQNIGESLVCLSVDVANALGSGEDVKNF